MQATESELQSPQKPPVDEVTLLELVTRLNRTTQTESETVETALGLLEAGSVRLIGNFRGCSLQSA